MNCGMTVQHEMQPFQGCSRFVPVTQGSSRTRKPGLIDPIPLGLNEAHCRRRPIFNFQFSIFNSQFRPESPELGVHPLGCPAPRTR